MQQSISRSTVRQQNRSIHLVNVSVFAVAFVAASIVSLASLPTFLGLRSFVILSGSMEPTISTGSIAIARPVPSDSLQVGDVIAFQSQSAAGLPTVHRIIDIQDRQGTRHYTTRGDANTGEDAEFTMPPTALRVIGAIPFVGYLVFYAAQPMATVALVIIPLVLLVMHWVKDQLARGRATRRV